MTIAFDGIPGSIRKPGRYIEFNTRLAAMGLPSGDRKILLIGQKTAAGSKAAETPGRVYSESEAIAYFGAGSVAHLMVKAALKANPYANISVIAPADGGGSVAASGTVTCTGPATSAGLLTLKIADKAIEVPVAAGDTATEIAAALKAALDNLPELPVTAAAAEGVVTLTAKNKGLLGNAILVSAENTAPGVTAVVVAMAGGLVDPDLTNSLTAVQAERYHRVVSSLNSTAALDKLETHMLFVSGPMEQRPGVGVFAYIGALADALQLAANYCTTGEMFCAYVRGSVSLPWAFAAAEAAVHVSESDPARPLNGLTLAGIAAPQIQDRLTRTEQEACLAGGLTPHEVNAAGDLAIVRAVTTYTTNAAGVKDTAKLDVTTLDTLNWLREAVATRIGLRFDRSKLNDRVKGAVKAEVYDVLKNAERLEIVEQVDEHADGLVVERAEGDPSRLNVAIPADVVNGLHVFAARIDLIL